MPPSEVGGQFRFEHEDGVRSLADVLFLPKDAECRMQKLRQVRIFHPRMMIPLLLLLLATNLVRSQLSAECPPAESLGLCSCQVSESQSEVLCSNLQNTEELQKITAALRGYKIHSLKVEDSYLGDVPGDIFEGTHIVVLTFSYTKITSIGDETRLPFSGLEDSLEELAIAKGFVGGDQVLNEPIRLGHLKNLRHLLLEENEITELSNDWFREGPESLKELFIITGRVKKLGDKAFASLSNLRFMHFSGNSVTVPRTALPSNGKFLQSIDLSDNGMTDLPTDLFTGFPSLKDVFLDMNALQTVAEDTWKDIFPQLSFVYLFQNPLVCDSNLKWMFHTKRPRVLFGECLQPERLKGRQLSSLEEEEID